MRVLLTGATGFVGSHVLPLLEGHEVVCCSRDPARLPARSGMQAISADLKTEGDWVRVIAEFRPEWCFHLAWEGLPDYSLERCRANLDASIRLLRCVAQSGVRRVVVAGSCFEYGAVSGAVSEDRTPIESSIFAATKRALLTVLDSVARQSSFEYRWARIFFVYGPRQRQTSLIPHIRAACRAGRAPEVREPAAMQDFVHVEDVAAGLLALAESGGPSGIFNLGTGQAASVAHVANLVAQYYGREPFFGSLPAGSGFWADTSKTSAVTGWRGRIDIRQGIEKTLAELDSVQ